MLNLWKKKAAVSPNKDVYFRIRGTDIRHESIKWDSKRECDVIHFYITHKIEVSEIELVIGTTPVARRKLDHVITVCAGDSVTLTVPDLVPGYAKIFD